MLREAIIEAYEKRGWNLLKLSKESGVTYSIVHGFMRGTSNVTSANADRLLEALKLRVVPDRKKKT